MNDFERFVDWANFLDISPRDAFDIAERHLDHFGREYCTLEKTHDEDSAACMEYLNQGDTYAVTLILTDDYVDGVALIVSSWGDWYETSEQVYCEEHNVYRCGYCSEFTDASGDWRDTICESCGNCVSG